MLLGFEGDGSAPALVAALAGRGADVVVIPPGPASVREARASGAALVCARLPLPGIDAIGLCAAMKAGAAPPGLVLVDPMGEASVLGDVLPDELRPDATLAELPTPSAILLALQSARDARSENGAADAAPVLVGPLFPELLVELAAARETGLLEVRAVGVRTNVYFRDGEPVLAEGGTVRQTLGRLLVRRGALSEADYVRVVERMTATPVDHEPLRMGEVLVALGLMTPAEVHEALRTQTREKILACFQWERFEHAFRPLGDLPDHVAGYRDAPVEALVLAGLKAHFDARRLAPLLHPHRDRHPLLEGDAGEIASRFQLRAPEQRFVQRLGGERSLDAWVRDSGLDALHAGHVLAALLLGRRLRLLEQPRRPAATPSPRASQVRLVSGAAADASAPAPARAGAPRPGSAAAAAPPRPAPAREAEPAAPSSEGRRPAGAPTFVQRALGGVARATQRLARGAADDRKGRLGAEEALQRGKALLRNGALAGALQQFERAVEGAPDELEYRLYAAWTEQAVAKDEDARMVARAKARALALQLAKQDRKHAKAHAVLGVLLADEGELEAAERHFRAALAGDPEEIDAKRGLRLVVQRRGR